MGGVPSVPTDRSRKVEVIAAGYSRTGTVSMALALEKLLDGPCMHGGTQLFGREDAYVKLWVDIFVNRHNKPVLMKLLREATAGFVAVADSPNNFFLPELCELYPDARVVLVTRNRESWQRSMDILMNKITVMPMWALNLFLWPMPTWRWMMTWMPAMGEYNMELHGAMLHEHEGGLLDLHNNWVRKQVPKDRLLTMELKEGWGPLCEFLEKPVPEGPLPHENDTKAMSAFVRRAFLITGATWVGILSTVGVVSWRAYNLLKR